MDIQCPCSSLFLLSSYRGQKFFRSIHFFKHTMIAFFHSFMLVIDKSLSHTLGTRLCFVSNVVLGQRRLIFLLRCGSCNDITCHELKHQRQYYHYYVHKIKDYTVYSCGIANSTPKIYKERIFAKSE